MCSMIAIWLLSSSIALLSQAWGKPCGVKNKNSANSKKQRTVVVYTAILHFGILFSQG